MQVKLNEIEEKKMINDSQVLMMLIVGKGVVQQFTISLQQYIPDAESCLIEKPLCIGSAIYPAKTIDGLFMKLENDEFEYVAILQDSYLTDIPNIRTAIQKYEVEYSSEKRLLMRRINMTDYIWADDFDLSHDFVFGKRVDVLAILQYKQGGKNSIANNS